jgi:hypothetical protein
MDEPIAAFAARHFSACALTSAEEVCLEPWLHQWDTQLQRRPRMNKKLKQGSQFSLYLSIPF